MQGDEKNLKDPERKPMALYGAGPQNMSVILSYNKTNKLITALYMVTDIIDEREPLRNKLRTLGIEILSDITSMTRSNLVRNIQAVLSFLNIAFTMNMISEMNKDILVNEFTQLKNLFIVPQDNPVWLEEFLKKEEKKGKKVSPRAFHNNSIGHAKSTRIGVQKGSTLMQALSDINSTSIDLKKERHQEILDILKNNFSNQLGLVGATITDIKSKAQGPIASCGEKTLQRELVSMMKENVLYKTGSKRWSRYLIKDQTLENQKIS